MKPLYASPETLAEFVPDGLLHRPLLCPHCRRVLLPSRVADPKPAAKGDGNPPPAGRRKRVRRHKTPKPPPPTPPAGEHYLDRPQEP